MASAHATLAGMFDLVDDKQNLNETILSLEIPIHTKPNETDYRLALNMKHCKQFNYLSEQYLMEIDLDQKSKEHKTLLEYIETNSGMEKNLSETLEFYATCLI